MNRFYATGRRKESTARVWLNAGSGKVTVNSLPAENYFKREVLRMLIAQAFETSQSEGKYDIEATVTGGGLSGQAGAIRLGVARALCLDDTAEYRAVLKKGGFLTRDARMVERKKFGRAGARKSFQYSKR